MDDGPVQEQPGVDFVSNHSLSKIVIAIDGFNQLNQ
jgi:hypothetical protein